MGQQETKQPNNPEQRLFYIVDKPLPFDATILTLLDSINKLHPKNIPEITVDTVQYLIPQDQKTATLAWHAQRYFHGTGYNDPKLTGFELKFAGQKLSAPQIADKIAEIGQGRIDALKKTPDGKKFLKNFQAMLEGNKLTMSDQIATVIMADNELAIIMAEINSSRTGEAKNYASSIRERAQQTGSLQYQIKDGQICRKMQIPDLKSAIPAWEQLPELQAVSPDQEPDIAKNPYLFMDALARMSDPFCRKILEIYRKSQDRTFNWNNLRSAGYTDRPGPVIEDLNQ